MTTGFRESAVGASCRNGVIFLTWEPLPRVRPNCGDVGASVSCVKAQEYNVGWYRVTYAPTGTAGRGFSYVRGGIDDNA